MIRRTVGPSIEVEVVAVRASGRPGSMPPSWKTPLLNLAINGRDAMPEGGRLTIETANKWLDERAARERELSPGQYLSICVTDTGTGIPKDIVDRIFDPFFTTKPIGQGTGLGLSMVHGFVRQSGGQVRVYSEPGEGTTMCLYLPRYHGDPLHEAARSDDRIVETGGGETVLVVDDEINVRMLITEVLNEAGYAALEAYDGSSALKLIQSEAKIDLLISDVGLPGGMNGRQVADAARQTRPGLRVLFVTGLPRMPRSATATSTAGDGGDHEAVRDDRHRRQNCRDARQLSLFSTRTAAVDGRVLSSAIALRSTALVAASVAVPARPTWLASTAV